MLSRVVGIFAFAFWDERSRELAAAVDHVGAKPLVWGCRGGRVVLASGCDAARALVDGLPGERVTLDPVGIRSVLAFGYCPPPRTVWVGLSKLGPGTMLRWRPGEAPVVECWWTPQDPGEEGVAEPDAAGDGWFATRWTRVLGAERTSDLPLGVFLSSGLDSTSVAAGLVEAGCRPLCLTVGMDADDESAGAASIAGALGLPHRTVGMRDRGLREELALTGCVYDEPQGFSALMTQRRLSEAAHGARTVLLGGDGGDELLGGYAWNRPDEIAAMHDFARRERLSEDAGELASAVMSPEADDRTRRRALGAHG